jgi:hypothetical protein
MKTILPFSHSKAVILLVILLIGFARTSLNAQTKSDSIKSTLHEHPELTYDVGKKFTIIGQVGFRLEYIYNERFAENDATADDDHRFRERVRLRFGAEFKPSKWFTAGFRMSTGSSTYPASGWSSFSDFFSRDNITLDRVYININANKFRFQMGANGNAMFHPTDMVWDVDVQPAGLAQVYQGERLEVTLGQYMITEVRDLGNPDLTGSFLIANGLNFAFLPKHNLRLGFFQYYYNKPSSIAAAIDLGYLDGDFKTNRIDPYDSTRFFSGFHTLGISGDYHWKKFRLVGEIAVNIGANQDASLGSAYAGKENFAAGGMLRYGLLQKPGDFSVEAGFFYIEADAVIAAYNSDDYQQTNVKSVPVFLKVLLPGDVVVVWDTYFQKRISTAYYLSGGVLHDENALKIRSRITVQLGF